MEMNATLLERITINDDLAIFRVQPDFDIPDFSAGQYVALSLSSSLPRGEHFPPEENPVAEGKLLRRAYSIASPPENKEALDFYVSLVPNGSFTTRLWEVEPGTRVHCAKKIVGTFVLDSTPEDVDLVFICTGTGLAPFMSMLQSEQLWKSPRRVSLLHGVRYGRDAGYSSFLRELERKRPEFSYHLAVSREVPPAGGYRGYVQTLLAEKIVRLHPREQHIFLSGNPAMVDELSATLGIQGHAIHSRKSAGNLHIEKFW